MTGDRLFWTCPNCRSENPGRLVTCACQTQYDGFPLWREQAAVDGVPGRPMPWVDRYPPPEPSPPLPPSKGELASHFQRFSNLLLDQFVWLAFSFLVLVAISLMTTEPCMGSLVGAPVGVTAKTTRLPAVCVGSMA